MNAAAWIALASAVLGLLSWLVIVSFNLGKITEKVRALEGRKDGSDCTAALAGMEATLRELKGALEHRISALEQTMQSFVMPKATRTRRAGGE